MEYKITKSTLFVVKVGQIRLKRRWLSLLNRVLTLKNKSIDFPELRENESVCKKLKCKKNKTLKH
jgi:hypothetical protein